MGSKVMGFTFGIMLIAAFIAFVTSGGLDERNNGEKTFRFSEIQEALADQGVELGEEDTVRKYFKLNGQRPRTFELANGEFLSIYEYRSVNARKKGESDFDKEKAEADMQIPEAYVVRNVWIHYWFWGPSDQQTDYGDRIEAAVVSLGGERITN